jgi:TatD DNase family protein
MNNLIDSHFHSLHMQKRGIDVRSLFHRLFSEGFCGGIDIGIDPGDMGVRTELLQEFPKIRLAAGIYPGFAEQMAAGASLNQALDTLDREISVYRPAAVGEIGLDLHWKYGTLKLQVELMRAQIDLAVQHNLPVIIHNRSADRETAEVLTDVHSPGGIIHCFSSDWETARSFLDAGFYISFAGTITYKKNGGLRDVLAGIPEDRLLLETDSPYLAPQAVRGMVNTPANMPHIYSTAATVRKVSLPQLQLRLLSNFRRLLENADADADPRPVEL